MTRDDPVVSVERRVSEWERRFRALVDDADEGEEPDDGALLIEGLALLQNAVDKALVRLEHQSDARLDAEAAALRAQIEKLQAARVDDEARHVSALEQAMLEGRLGAADLGDPARQLADIDGVLVTQFE